MSGSADLLCQMCLIKLLFSEGNGYVQSEHFTTTQVHQFSDMMLYNSSKFSHINSCETNYIMTLRTVNVNCLMNGN